MDPGLRRDDIEDLPKPLIGHLRTFQLTPHPAFA
jgi:hypothetical protein